MRELLGIMLRKEGFEVVVADSRAMAASVLAKGPVDLVITDVKLPDGDGIEILRHVKAAAPETLVIVMTAFGSTQTAVAALKLGAHDYLTKPFDIEELKIVVRSSLERRQLQEENLLLKAEFRSRHGLDRIVGVSPAMAAVFDLVRSVAGTGSTVLITGESGTGKELVAKAIHALSPRRDAPFVSVNCGALTETLLESELFGHMKGAFTDAHQTKKGLFEAAHRGTLFLDEVGETPPAMQVKLLRALQDRRIRRVGGTDEVDVDVRVVAATNRSLERLVEERRLREDLFYRLNVVPFYVPPLRERMEDVPLLADYFLKEFTTAYGRKPKELTSEALQVLADYPWPGNVRELRNLMERIVIMNPQPRIDARHIPLDRSRRAVFYKPVERFGSLQDVREAAERDYIARKLEETKGNVTRAAEALGLERSHLYRKMKALGIAAKE